MPHKVQFSHERIGPLPHYRVVLHCTPNFEQAFSGLQLDNAQLDQKLPQADVQLANLHREYASARLAALSLAPDFAGAIRQWLLEQLVNGVPDRETAARQFGLSDRVFARRLQSLGLSYTDLVDTVRKDAACVAVTKTALPFGEIARSLGFVESSTFNRAFKRWTGQTPGACREQVVRPD